MRDFITYLIEHIEDCITTDISDIRKVDKALVFGTNAYEVTLKLLDNLKCKDSDVYIILQPQMHTKIKADISAEVNVIEWDGSYNLELVKYINDKTNITFDAVLFYFQQANDLGNRNILQIARNLSENIMVFGMDKSFELIQYKNFSYYYDALLLYDNINKFVNRTEELTEK